MIEAGLGGRYDATNVIPSKVQVLTSVGLEHTRWLGPTLTDIAGEKLAVVSRAATLVLGAGLDPEVRAVAERVAAERGARIVHAGTDPGRGGRRAGRLPAAQLRRWPRRCRGLPGRARRARGGRGGRRGPRSPAGCSRSARAADVARRGSQPRRDARAGRIPGRARARPRPARARSSRSSTTRTPRGCCARCCRLRCAHLSRAVRILGPCHLPPCCRSPPSSAGRPSEIVPEPGVRWRRARELAGPGGVGDRHRIDRI